MPYTLVLIPVLFTLWFDAKAGLARALARVWNGRLPNGRLPVSGGRGD